MKNKSPLFPAGVVTVTSLLLGLQEDESFLNITFSLSDHIMQFFGGRGAGGGGGDLSQLFNLLYKITEKIMRLLIYIFFLTKLDSLTNDWNLVC